MSVVKPVQRRLPGGGLNLPPLSRVHRDALEDLAARMPGRVRYDDVHRALYTTDASLYELTPAGVAFPKSAEEMTTVVRVCRDAGLPITARGAGTSLSGQTVGEGLILDVGRHMNAIGEVDVAARTVDVEPGVILDNLNRALKPTGLFFAPDTSTSNRCMIGGMIGNNSCGSHSILYGTTRDHLDELDVLMADGVVARLGAMEPEAWKARAAVPDQLGHAMRSLGTLVHEHRSLILERWPKPEVTRRNTGYALDELASSFLAAEGLPPANLARFLAGSEGTLGLTTRARLRLEPRPRVTGVVAVHFDRLQAAFEATVTAVAHGPAAVELMDRRILQLAAANPEQARHGWFIQGEPEALLLVEFYAETEEAFASRVEGLVADLKGAGHGYAWPVLRPPRVSDVWALRKAGLGVLMGAPGDIKPVTIVEDTAVAVADLPAYMAAFAEIMARHEADCVYYAHASVGEIHLRPELNLKDPRDVDRAESIASEVADLVASFRGALSGEHGDGRVRSPFLEQVLGAEGVALLEKVKDAFDPTALFNPNNIVRPRGFREDWRYPPTYKSVPVPAAYAYRESGSLQQMVERCNGAGVCRRTAEAGGTMCPSYMATLEEVDSTRGRANLFRRLVQQGPEALYRSTELYDALDLCLSCKGCRSDCPASVDMARLKGDFLQGWYDRHGVPLRARGIADLPDLATWARRVPGGVAVFNAAQRVSWLKRLGGVAPQRALPRLTPGRHGARPDSRIQPGEGHGRVLLFIDEFTDLFEPELAEAAAQLLEAGGWRVEAPPLGVSGRTWLSKGMLRVAKARIQRTMDAMEAALGDDTLIVGIEPSAILTFLDEAIDLQDEPERRAQAERIAGRVRLIDTFVAEAAAEGRWSATFRPTSTRFVVHGHCHQKSLVGLDGTLRALSLIPGAQVRALPTGCCGMAGSFGYEEEHYALSQSIGELVLFPAARKLEADERLVAPGTSCRHQIADGAQVQAVHPVLALWEALETAS